MIDWINSIFASPVTPNESVEPELRLMLRESLRECEALYRAGARLAQRDCPQHISGDPRKFVRVMGDLQRGLVVKILIEIGQSDRHWHTAECEVAKMVLRHTWGVKVKDADLAQTLQNVADHSETLKWTALVAPFVQMPPLHDQIPELIALAMRIANLVAKADGQIQPSETAALHKIERELAAALDTRRDNTEKPDKTKRKFDVKAKVAGVRYGDQAVAVQEKGTTSNDAAGTDETDETENALSPEERRETLQQAIEELRQLTGLQSIKQDIRELIDFVKIQKRRQEHSLPATPVSLHAVFEGNPGTGKTTVARILGRIFCGLNLLDKGHTIETDRSGLVAEYAGQTGPRTHERIDEALHGVLFVDEAYSLISQQGQDAFGVEAIQAMLKRMEDDRERLIVVLAGYPIPMRRLLRSNAGLSSRFQRTFSFPDYSVDELLEIFQKMCKKCHYQLTKAATEKLRAGFQHESDRKDEHFGNGRLARNVFEETIRRQASRLVSVAPLTCELLKTIEAEDVADASQT